MTGLWHAGVFSFFDYTRIGVQRYEVRRAAKSLYDVYLHGGISEPHKPVALSCWPAEPTYCDLIRERDEIFWVTGPTC